MTRQTTRRSIGQPRQRTLRGRVSAVGLVVVAAWLVLLTVVINVLLAQRLARDIDARLRTRATDVAATVRAGAGGHLVVSEPAADDALDSGIWVFAGTRAVERPPADSAVQHAARRVAAGPGGFVTVDSDIRLYAQPIIRSGRQVGAVVTALSTAASHRSRDEALIGSIALALLALAGAYAALRWTAARALRPVDQMTHQAAEWSATRLSERFEAHQKFTELEELAQTFNGVLDRQAAAVRHERQLLAELSHELRTPLSRIVAEADLLLARPHTPTETDTAHAQIRDTAMAMNRIIETLLNASRAENLAATGSCRLDTAIDAAVDAVLKHRGEGHSAQSRPDVEIDVPELTVGVESAVVERILAPLLDNAARHAAATVNVTARQAEESVLVEISDDGPGVEPGLEEEIFTPGTQFDQIAPSGGAGLGLALARRLARAASGDVTFLGGSTFQVRLPPA